MEIAERDPHSERGRVIPANDRSTRPGTQIYRGTVVVLGRHGLNLLATEITRRAEKSLTDNELPQ